MTCSHSQQFLSLSAFLEASSVEFFLRERKGTDLISINVTGNFELRARCPTRLCCGLPMSTSVSGFHWQPDQNNSSCVGTVPTAGGTEEQITVMRSKLRFICLYLVDIYVSFPLLHTSKSSLLLYERTHTVSPRKL